MQFSRHRRIACDGCQKGENSIALEHSRTNCLPKVFVLTWGQPSIRVSAEERSCLEGVCTVRSSEKGAGDESEKKKLRQIVDSL